MAIVVVLNTRELQKRQIFASGPCSTPLPILPVGQVLCHLYTLSYSLALVIQFLTSPNDSTSLCEQMYFKYYLVFPVHVEYSSILIRSGWALAVLIETYSPSYFLQIHRHFFIGTSIITIKISVGYPYISPACMVDAPCRVQCMY